MKRIETLVKEGHADLDAQRYKPDVPINGVYRLDIARALDKIREGEKILRQAFPDKD